MKDDRPAHEPVTVRILDKEYRIACPPDERDALLSSARYLNERMREMRDTGKVIGIDRISVMAGLNVVHEMLRERERFDRLEQETLPRLASLQARMQDLLDRNRNTTIDF